MQTDIGNVLGIEVDRDDRVQTIKKKLQVALCLPTEQSALTFGDVVLEHDFNEVRNDSPILLTRGLYRTSSTPCISPVVGKIKSKGRNKPLEIIGGYHGCPKVRELVRQCVKALDNGVEPIPAGGGLGGAYFIQNVSREKIAIVKPTDEEPFAPNNPNGFVGKTLGQPGLKRSIRIGETGIREVAAYLLDHDHFAKVPPTALVKATHSNFNVNTNVLPCNSEPFVKIGSLQRFIPHEYDASEHGTSQFPVGAVHRIGILDVRILNTDRHAGNILVRKLPQEKCNSWTLFDLHVYDALELIPIDHGLCLPEAIDDPYFEWLHWPQAALPFSEEELEYIKNLNAASDAELLRKELPMLRESCLRVLMITTAFLQKAAVAGLSLAEIGSMMTREIGTMADELSELESICVLAKLDADHELSLIRSSRALVKTIADEFSLQLHRDQEGQRIESSSMSKGGCSSFPQSSIATSSDLFKPSESTQSFVYCNPKEGSSANSDISEEATFDLDEESATTPKNQEASVVDPKTVFLSGKRNYGSNSSGKMWMHSTAEARSEPSSRLVSSPKLARTTLERSVGKVAGLNLNEMGEEEWSIFMECFQRLLPEAFANRKARNFCLMSRLGTSCQF